MPGYFWEDFKGKVFSVFFKNMLEQIENKPEGEPVHTKGMPEAIRACGEEGIVLLKNDGALPLKEDETIAVFGRCQNDWFYVGYGSGGDVHAPYHVSLMDGLKKAGVSFDEPLADIYRKWGSRKKNKADHGVWGQWPYHHPEMPLSDAFVKRVSLRRTKAVVVIGRAAGEDRENRLLPGSYYLTDVEKDMLKKVSAHFKEVILILNCGNRIDLSFAKKYPISAILCAWQLGQESGNAVANVLCGAVNPSGKLADTFARSYEDYPGSSCFGGHDYNNYEEDIYVGYRYFATFGSRKVLYPFGYGLSYTTFDIRPVAFTHENGIVTVTAEVTNTGSCAGKEVVQIYVTPPSGRIRKAKKALCGFAKTKLLMPQESETVIVSFSDEIYASYDDNGASGFCDAFVLEKGSYAFTVGNSSAAGVIAGDFSLSKTRLIRQCESACAVDAAAIFSVITEKGKLPVTASGRDLAARIRKRLPKEITPTGDAGILLSDVKAGRHTMEEFIAQLSDRELCDLVRGEGGMRSALGAAGNAGAFGGITKSLRKKGIPALITSDGPAGLRLNRYTSLLPCGISLACTWNPPLVEALYSLEGSEAAALGVDVLLGPGMNIHRNPLCGRNFEYYSEDPVLSGKIAAAAVRGIESSGVSACPKHFAANHQETNRNKNDSRISEQALREIYLRNFEICVKEGKPRNIMTSYNKINGVWSHYNYDLAVTILRNEWGYRGCVITDWWMQLANSPEFPALANNAYRVRAGVDVLMPGGLTPVKQFYIFDDELYASLQSADGITRAELQRSAENVLGFALTRI